MGDRRMRRFHRRPAQPRRATCRSSSGALSSSPGRAPTSNVFDVTTKVDVDATLSCRGDEFLRFEARIGEPANARTTTEFRALSDGGAEGGAGLGRGQKPRRPHAA